MWLLVYCLPGVTQKVLPIQRFLYTGFFFQEYRKKNWDVPQPKQPITIWRVQKYAGHFNLLFLYMGFSLLSTRCHTKGPTNLQVLIYAFECIVFQVSHKRSYQSTGSYISLLVYCLPSVTQKGLPIYRFLYMAFSVLSTRCHTKGPTNLEVLIYGMFLLGIHQEDLECSSTTTANHYLESAEVCRASYFIGSYIWVFVY